MFRSLGFLVVLFLSAGALIPVKGKAQEYQSPNFSNASKLVPAPGIAAEHEDVREALFHRVLQIALVAEGEPGKQSRALGIAWALADSSELELVALADIQLRFGVCDERAQTFSGYEKGLRETDFGDSILDTAKQFYELDRDAYQLVAGLSENLGAAFLGKSSNGGILGENQLDEQWKQLDPGSAGRMGGNSLTGSGSKPTGGAGYAVNQSSLHGLLVMELEGGEVAGGASKMNATVSAGSGSIQFNQEVGPMMTGALKEVQKYLAVRHGKIPGQGRVEISFEDRHRLKDGPSAAVACSLLLDALVTGGQLDTGFAVTGDMNADGGVQPVGGIDGKIRGATRAKCTHVAIPRDNMSSLSDIYILDGIRPFFEIQIFSIGTFDEALRLAGHSEGRDGDVASAMKQFEEVVVVLKNAGSMAVLSNPKVVAKLREVVRLTPNHESAKVLLLQGSGRGPKHLSLQGSFVALDRCSSKVIQEGKGFTSDVNTIKDTVNELRRLRNMLDPRTKPALDAFQDLLSGITEMHDKDPVRGSSRHNEILSRIKRADNQLSEAYASIRANPEIQEELNY